MGRRLPIRWRLTAWYAALLSVALLVFGAALYVGLRAQLYEGLDDQLYGQSTLLAGAVRVAAGRPTLDITVVDGTDADHFVRLWTLDGEPVTDTSQNLRVPPPDADLFAAVATGRTRWTRQQAGSEPLRLITIPVRVGGPVVGVMQVGVSRGDVEETLATVLALLGIAAPIVLGMTVWGGYLLAGRALAPVATITRMAGSLGGSDFTARLGLDLPDDELGRLARTFDTMLGRIGDAFERQRRFTGDAAHELRTPLALIRGQVDLALARPRSTDEYRDALRDFDRDLTRLSGLVGTLLTLARADTGLLPVDRARFDVAETIAVVVEQYADLARENGIVLHRRTLPTPLAADEDLCIQLLVNLIDNALAHTASGGTVCVGCRMAGAEVVVEVADTGTGIAPEHQERVFNRFYRVDDGRARAQGGSGLGLSICRAIAEAHGGTISLTSEQGRGTRIEVRLPSTA